MNSMSFPEELLASILGLAFAVSIGWLFWPSVLRTNWIKQIGLLVGLCLLMAGFWIAYSLWPTGLTDIPISSITLGEFLRAMLSVLTWIIATALLLLLFVKAEE